MFTLIWGFLQGFDCGEKKKKTGAKWRTHIGPNEVDGAINKIQFYWIGKLWLPVWTLMNLDCY